MDVGAKLQLNAGQTVAVIAGPPDVALGLPDDVSGAADPANADAVIVFVINQGELPERVRPAVDATRGDRLAWVAYPKAGGLDTDLNRDRLAALMSEYRVRPVRQVAIDQTWSALRFRPA